MNIDLKKILVLLAASIALIAGGCGGDDTDDGGSESESGEALSAEDYATQIDDIRITFGEASIEIGTELQSVTSSEQLQTGVGELEEVTQTAVDDLNALEPPEEATEGHDALVTTLEGYLGDIQALSAATESGDDAELEQAGADFQASATSIQTDLQDALQQLTEAGIPLEGVDPES